MGDEELVKVHMASLAIERTITKAQIDEYVNRGLANFMGVGGNIPWGEFIKKYGSNPDYILSVPTNERFYLAEQPFAWCGYIDRNQRIEKEDYAPITGLRFVSLTTRKPIRLDIRRLLVRGRFYDGGIYRAKGTINTHIFDIISNAVPYITLKEVLQETVRFIGNKHIYFEEEKVRGKKLISGYDEPRPWTVILLNGYFAENVCYTSR